MKATFLLALLLYVLIPGIAHGQCQIQTFPDYAVSSYESLSSDGNDIINTVVLDGSSSMQMNYPCPDSIITAFNNGKINIMHYPSVQNQVGAVNGGTNFPSICAECYGSFQSDVDSGPVSPGQILATTYGGQIYCATAGIIFTVTMLKSIEIAETLSQTTGGTSGQWTVTPYCTPATTPPDYAPNLAPKTDYSPYWLQKAICKNNSGMPNGVFCFPTTTTAKPAPQDRYACTKQLQ